MKTIFLTVIICAVAFAGNRAHAQDLAIKPGERAAITFFDFDFAAGYFGNKSVKVDENGSNELDNRTLHQVLRSLEASINEKYGVMLEPAKYDTTDETKWITAKCYPKIKKKDAIAMGYDKIIEVRAYMRPSAAMGVGIGPVSTSSPKPIMYMNLKIFDKSGKQVFDTSAQVKDDERQKSLSIAGFQTTGGFTGASILELYSDVLAKIFVKAEKK